MRRLPPALFSLLTLIILMLLVGSPDAGADEPPNTSPRVVLKMATLAPPGSAWAKVMDRSSKDVLQGTQGRVGVHYYWGGQQGDERDVVRKMKLGQLDGAALTAVGLGLVKSDVRVLELPYLFRSYEEIDHVRHALEAEFEKQFDEAGYILLSWGDVGWVHSYSTKPIRTREDLKKTRAWIYADDPISRAMFAKAGIPGVPLGVPEVLPALQTGQVETIYGPPLAAVALQWYTKVKFATTEPSAYSIGALVIRKASWDKLRPEDQAFLRARGRETRDELTQIVRRDNERAKHAMEKAGIQFVATPPAALAESKNIARQVWDELAGKVYSRELLQRVQAAIAQVRKP